MLLHVWTVYHDSWSGSSFKEAPSINYGDDKSNNSDTCVSSNILFNTKRHKISA